MKVLSIEEVHNTDFKTTRSRTNSLSSQLRNAMTTMQVNEGLLITASECKNKNGPRTLIYGLSSEVNKTLQEWEKKKFSVRERVGGGWIVIRLK